jgi:ATP-dependent DNA ligase
LTSRNAGGKEAKPQRDAPLIAKAVAALPIQSCFIDGEAVVLDCNGLSVFDLLRYRQHDDVAVLWRLAEGVEAK